MTYAELKELLALNIAKNIERLKKKLSTMRNEVLLSDSVKQ